VKILLISYDLRRRGGIERLSADVVFALRAEGHQLVVLSTRRLGPGPLGRALGQLWFLGRLALACRRCDELFSMHALLLSQVDWLLPRRLPRLCWLHGVEVWGTALPPLAPALGRCRQLLASSRFTRERVLAQPGPWPPVQVLHPPARLWDGLPMPAPLAPNPPGLRLLTVARMAADERYKGHGLVFQALAQLKSKAWQWQIVGSGNDRPRLEALSRGLGLGGQVSFLGDLSDDQLRQAYGDCNLLVMPSSYGLRPDGSASGEGFGIAYLEAALAGRASLGCILGGQADLILDGETGWLVEPEVEAVALVLRQALQHPPELLRRGEAARRQALQHFGESSFRAALTPLLGA
jgi:glycosyltransferase involved in cell wall biosynthesis